MNLLLTVAHRARKVWWRVARPTTVGVCGLLVRDDEVLLVRQTYQRGWYLPGGGVKRRETLAQAAARELREEVGAEVDALELFGAYTGLAEGKTDHIVVYLSRSFRLSGDGDREIAEQRFFPLDELPDDTAPGTRRRVDELRTGQRGVFGDW